MKQLSIRWRITFWNTAAFTLVLLGFGFAIYGLLRKTHYDQIDRTLLAHCTQIVERHIDGATGSPAGPASRSGHHVAYVFDAQGQIIGQNVKLSANDVASLLPPAAIAPRFDTVRLPEFGHARRLVARLSNAGGQHTIVLLAELQHVDEELSEVIWALALTTPITLIVAASLAYFLAYKSLAPVDELRRLTDEISASRLDRRLPFDNPTDELGRLAKTVNAMIARLEQSFSEIRRFTADASHELRTPVAIIRSEAELGLAADTSRENTEQRFRSIVEECSRMADLTAQLLALCREDAGVSQLTRAPVNIANLIRESTDSMQPAAAGKQQELTSHLATNLVIEGDAERLRQVVLNLLENAIKFTPAGGSIQIGLEKRDGDAVMRVRDTGLGISDEHLPHIFDRFYQISTGRSQPDSGAGLGLSIVKSIVEAHGGRVEVTAEPGTGAEFRVVLPLSI